MVPWFFHLHRATSAARRGAHVSPVTYRSQRTKRAPDIPCPVPTRHQRSWSRRLFHSAQSIRLLETESRFHSNIQISFDQTKVGSLPCTNLLTVNARIRHLQSTADEGTVRPQNGKDLNMIPTNISLDGQNLTLLEAQLMEGDILRYTAAGIR